MNKRELKKWLDAQEEQALRTVNDSIAKAIEQEETKVIVESGLKDLLEEFCKNNEDWFERFGQLVESNSTIRSLLGYTSSPIRCLKMLSNGLESSIRETKFFIDRYNCKEIAALIKRKEELREQVKLNYFNVKKNVALCKDAKQAIQYLTELGFDIPKDDKTDNTALASVVDVRYLLITPKNQQVESHEQDEC